MLNENGQSFAFEFSSLKSQVPPGLMENGHKTDWILSGSNYCVRRDSLRFDVLVVERRLAIS
jgi:hypothetical protein